MLIKLTSKCTMMCPHCMEDAQPEGLMMTLDTFKQAVKFGTYIGSRHFVLSGGEPTENEHITEMCEWLDMATGCNFTIVSNGMWLKDETKRQRVDWITRRRNYLGMQVYTHRQWYKDYDCVVTSPPYNFNLRVHYDRYIKSSPYERNRVGGVNENKYGQTYTDDLSIEEYYEWQCQCIDEMLRVSRDVVFYNIQMVTGNKVAVLQILGRYADRIREVLIWDKQTAEPAMHFGCLNSEYELIIAFDHGDCKGRQFRTANFERGTMSNVIRIGKNRENDHRAAFPLLLPQTLIHYFTNEGQTILDPFMGSGTTAIACIREHRHFLGFELNNEYYDKAVQRIERERQQLTLF